MGLQFKDLALKFQWQTTPAGIPIASDVATIGGGRWVTVCPICGCAHELKPSQPTLITPPCIAYPQDFQHHRQAWVKLHPQAAGQNAIFIDPKPESEKA